jgi:tRNA threonylcarbamoyl adenosine modification protein (Sua5/YciO/YrdC/YwlC family)
MIEYIVAQNIDHRILKRAARILEEGGLVAFPTDSSWSIGCSVQSKAGIARLQKLKGTPHFTPTITCADIAQWTDFTLVDTAHYRLAKQLVPGPYVFVFKSLGSFEKKFGLRRPEVGLRIPDNPVPVALVNTLGHALFTCTASRVMNESGWWDPIFAEENLFEYGYELDDIEEIDLILDPGESQDKALTTVIDLTQDEPQLIRQGTGEF